MPSGFSIIIAGKHFDPTGFVAEKPHPKLPWEIVAPSKEQPQRSFALELYDVLPERFSLDLVTELFEFLSQHREELSRALSAPGVEFRSLNVYDEPHCGSTEFSFCNDQLRMIVDLGLKLCVEDLGSMGWTAGSRLLYRLEKTGGDQGADDQTPSAVVD